MAQNILDHMMNGSEQGRQLLEVLSEIADEEQASIFFSLDGLMVFRSIRVIRVKALASCWKSSLRH